MSGTNKGIPGGSAVKVPGPSAPFLMPDGSISPIWRAFFWSLGTQLSALSNGQPIGQDVTGLNFGPGLQATVTNNTITLTGGAEWLYGADVFSPVTAVDVGQGLAVASFTNGTIVLEVDQTKVGIAIENNTDLRVSAAQTLNLTGNVQVSSQSPVQADINVPYLEVDGSSAIPIYPGVELFYTQVGTISFAGNATLSSPLGQVPQIAGYAGLTTDATITVSEGNSYFNMDASGPTFPNVVAPTLVASANNMFGYFGTFTAPGTVTFIGALNPGAPDGDDYIQGVVFQAQTQSAGGASLAGGALSETITVGATQGLVMFGFFDETASLDLTLTNQDSLSFNLLSGIGSGVPNVNAGTVWSTDILTPLTSDLVLTVSNGTTFESPGYLWFNFQGAYDQNASDVTVTVPPLSISQNGTLISGDLLAFDIGPGLSVSGSGDSALLELALTASVGTLSLGTFVELDLGTGLTGTVQNGTLAMSSTVVGGKNGVGFGLLVSGDLPGPDFISDGSGQAVLVPVLGSVGGGGAGNGIEIQSAGTSVAVSSVLNFDGGTVSAAGSVVTVAGLTGAQGATGSAGLNGTLSVESGTFSFSGTDIVLDIGTGLAASGSSGSNTLTLEATGGATGVVVDDGTLAFDAATLTAGPGINFSGTSANATIELAGPFLQQGTVIYDGATITAGSGISFSPVSGAVVLSATGGGGGGALNFVQGNAAFSSSILNIQSGLLLQESALAPQIIQFYETPDAQATYSLSGVTIGNLIIALRNEGATASGLKLVAEQDYGIFTTAAVDGVVATSTDYVFPASGTGYYVAEIVNFSNYSAVTSKVTAANGTFSLAVSAASDGDIFFSAAPNDVGYVIGSTTILNTLGTVVAEYPYIYNVSVGGFAGKVSGITIGNNIIKWTSTGQSEYAVAGVFVADSTTGSQAELSALGINIGTYTNVTTIDIGGGLSLSGTSSNITLDALAQGLEVVSGTTTVSAVTELALGANLLLTTSTTAGIVTLAASSTASANLTFEQNGTSIATAGTLNFGTGLSATSAGGIVTLAATGGGGRTILSFETVASSPPSGWGGNQSGFPLNVYKSIESFTFLAGQSIEINTIILQKDTTTTYAALLSADGNNYYGAFHQNDPNCFAYYNINGGNYFATPRILGVQTDITLKILIGSPKINNYLACAIYGSGFNVTQHEDNTLDLTTGTYNVYISATDFASILSASITITN